MSYPKYWDPTRVRQVFTTESRQKARDLFLHTHRPFQHIRVDFCKDDGAPGAFVHEDQVRAVVQGGALHADNRLFLVVGEAGSGKSELCQWLEYTVDTRRSLPIHIPRSMTTAAHVVALLRQALGATAPSGAFQHTPLTTQANYVALAAVVLLYEQGATALTPVDSWARLFGGAEVRQALSAHLGAAIQGTLTSAPILDDAMVQSLCATYGIAIHHADTPTAARRILARALEQVLWLGDLRSLLTTLSDHVIRQGRRPLLLLEDVTAFQILGDRLLDYLLDLTSGHFDAVIGVTTGFERTQLAGATLAGDLTHIHHRLRARFVLTDDHGRAYGLEDDLIDLARGYLDAVRGADPTPQSLVFDAGFHDGLYPFSETALRRAFACLQEEGNPRQTPRLFLEHVLAAALLHDDPPSVTFDRSPYLVPPPALFRADEVHDPRLHSLFRWYGAIGDDAITLDARIVQHFGITLPDGQPGDTMLRVSRAYMAQAPDTATPADWQQELRELQTWLRDGGLYPNRETLKRGIEHVLLQLGDPRALGSPVSNALAGAHIYYARGDERLPIYLGRGSGDQASTPTYVKIQIAGTPEERGILEEFAYLALSGGELSQVCRNTALTLDWAQRHWQAYNTDVRNLFASRMDGLTVEQFIWVTWRFLCYLTGVPWDSRPHVQAWQVDAHAYAHHSPWSAQQHPACYSAGEMLTRYHETMRRLFIGAFMLRDSLLDVERCAAMHDATSTQAIVHQLARLSLPTLRALPYKIRPLGQNLYDVLVPLQRYAQALTQMDPVEALRVDLDDVAQREAHLAAQQHLDYPALRQQLLTLRWRCGEVGVTWQERWNVAVEVLNQLTQEQVAAWHQETRRIRQSAEARQATAPDIWDYQLFRQQLRAITRHPYWDAVATVQSIQAELLAMARTRYQRGGGLITGTQPYRQLLSATRAVWQELAND